MNIKPDIVRRLRKAARWTQERLAEEAKLDKTTVSRLERGVYNDPRGATAQKLGKALRVDFNVLTGEAPYPENRERTFFDRRTPVTLAVDDAAFNALTLAAGCYRVEASQIVELAPFLFSWVAEESLRRRKAALDTLNERMSAIASSQDQMPHVSSILGYSPLTEELISEEERSIRARDIFAEGMRDRDTGDILKSDFDESTDGPIVALLRDMAGGLPDALEFEDWSPRGSPSFKVCRDEAAALFGGDQNIAEAILNGFVRLSKMPADLQRKGEADGRLAWARQEHASYRERLDAELLTFGFNPDDFLLADSDGAKA